MSDTTYAERNRENNAARSRERSKAVADIGTLPPIADPQRREECRLNLAAFLQTYFPNSTGLSPFSPDHLRVIERIERCILDGGRFINAVYRGFAKTTIATNAAIWATIYGHRRSVVVFSANEPQAQDLINSVKLELSENDLLYADFPDVCHAVRELEGKPQRCHSQTHNGELTHIAWRADRVILPTIQGAKSSGAILASRGMTGSGTRGLVTKTPSGINQRPDFVIVDDPQTDETAATPAQVRKRLDILRRSILRLGGHDRQIACVVNATVIATDDMVEQLLNPKLSPSWQGERIRMVRAWSNLHESFWLGKYAEVRNTFDRDNPDDQRRAHKEATEIYLEHYEDANAGCVVSWEHCYNKESELSAIQHAYNILIDDGPDVFATECQNEPKKDAAEEGRLTPAEIAARLNGFERKKFPRDVEHVTTFIDVQQSSLWYVTTAWQRDFTGYVIDYGTFPEQSRRYFTLNDIHKTLDSLYAGQPLESQLYSGLGELVGKLAATEYERADGAKLRHDRILIDANWGFSTKTVKRFCQSSPHNAILTPTHGRGIRAGDVAMGSYPVRAGERRGNNWILKPDAEATGLRHLLYDGNFWKSFLHSHLRIKYPASESLSLWGNDHRSHEMFADHMCSETPIRTEGRGRVVEQWELRPERPDNHFFDCLVGCAVGASFVGVATDHMKIPDKKRLRLSDIQNRARRQ
jgi:hypothetical protein